MKNFSKILSELRKQKGAIIVWVSVGLFGLLGFTALAIDFGHRHVVQNELKNAADAGALAGTRFLYHDDGSAINDDGYLSQDGTTTVQGTNQIAFDAATANNGQGVPVDVNWTTPSGNTEDIQRGHWSFGFGSLPRGFYPNDSTTAINIAIYTEVELDEMLNNINAVRVVTRRQATGTPVISFFNRIFGYGTYEIDDEAVAYIGFASELGKGEADQPIAICREALEDDFCNIGRMINSGSNDATHNTGGWTNFTQIPECETASANSVRDVICAGGNPFPLTGGMGMGTTGGMESSSFNDFIDCWKSSKYDSNENGEIDDEDDPLDGDDTDDIPEHLWNMTLPVILCPENNISNCATLDGAVNVNVVWITGVGNDPGYNDAPKQMDDWGPGDYGGTGDGSDVDGQTRWANFVEHFNLLNVDDQPAPYAKKSVYFLPDCTPSDLAGGTGGPNFGIRAEIPVLVQ